MSTASGLKNLFFVKRRPKWKLLRNPDWKNPFPNDLDTWKQEFSDNGFILWVIPDSPTHIKAPTNAELLANANPPVPAKIADDLTALGNSRFLPTFFKLDHRAKYHQNWFYMYQWIFVIFAFLTTLCGGFTVLISTQASIQGSNIQNGGLVDPTASNIVKLSGAVTAIMAAVTSATNLIYNHFKPQQKWFTCRRQAEILRAEYFLFLAHIGAYQKPDQSGRNRALRETIREVESTLS